jgi:hypothetical protein
MDVLVVLVWLVCLFSLNYIVTTVFSFQTTLQVNGDGSLSVSNFQFTTNSPCFITGETASGSFTLNPGPVY